MQVPGCEDFATVALSHLREGGVAIHSAQVHPNVFRQHQHDGTRINLPFLSGPAGIPNYFVMSNVINDTEPNAGSWGNPTFRNSSFEPSQRRDVKMSIIIDDEDVARTDNMLRSCSGYDLTVSSL